MQGVAPPAGTDVIADVMRRKLVFVTVDCAYRLAACNRWDDRSFVY